MKKMLGWIAAAALVLSPVLVAAEGKVPAGKENLVLDYMSKAKEAAKKKVIKGPVPFAHQAHVDKGVACLDCHHKDKSGETPKACSSCHKDKDGDGPKLQDAFHFGTNKDMPSPHSCIGCHAKKTETTAPAKQEPCTACHSILKK